MEEGKRKTRNIQLLDSRMEAAHFLEIKKLENHTKMVWSSLQSFIEDNHSLFYNVYSTSLVKKEFLLNEKISAYVNILLGFDLSLIKKLDAKIILHLYDPEKSLSFKIKTLLSFHNQIFENFKKEIESQYRNVISGNMTEEQ